MKRVLYKAIPFDKKLVTLALESGVDGVIADKKDAQSIRELGRVEVLTPAEARFVVLASKKDEEKAADHLKKDEFVVLETGWEIIPVENLLAVGGELGAECESLDRARLAAGVLERGVDAVVVTNEGAADLKEIVKELKLSQGTMELEEAEITAVEPAGLGHRVCVDTLTKLRTGQGMLVGNSSAFTFLVHAETESNPYVAARPFRINAGAVHAYAKLPGDKTAYLEEVVSGREVLIVSADGSTTKATVGRAKVEIRPMLLIRAKVGDIEGAVFLQNAETIRLTKPGGVPVSVVALKPGDKILVRTDQAGRHFGMRIQEEITEE